MKVGLVAYNSALRACGTTQRTVEVHEAPVFGSVGSESEISFALGVDVYGFFDFGSRVDALGFAERVHFGD